MRILIKNGRIWDGERFCDADILTDGEFISEIDSNISGPADWIYDAAGEIVTAGLVDAHVHLRGISGAAHSMYPESACFPFGVTAAADAGAVLGDRKLLDALPVKICTFVPVPVKNNHADFTRTEELLEQYGHHAIGLKIYFDAAQNNISDITPLKEICQYAHERDLKVMVHSSNSPVSMAELSDTLDKGDILTHAFHGGVNNAAEDGFASMVRAKARGVVIDVGFAGYKQVDFGILGAAISQGVLPDTISTDMTWKGAYKRGGRYGLTMCMSIAKTLHMREEEIFRAVTTSPARALGRDDVWGALKVGRYADIAVLKQTEESFHLTDYAGNRIWNTQSYRCDLTIADGIVAYRD